MERPTDPWKWTVDDVVDQLCKPNSLLESRPNTRLTDPAILEQIIRDNEIDGSVLLLHTNMGTLKDIGITKLGERSGLLTVRDLLRARSLGYKLQASELQSDVFSQPQTPTGTVTRREREPHEDFSSPALPALERPLKRVTSTEPVQQREIMQANPLTRLGEQPSILRAHESYVEDQSGRKRRRLNLQTATNPQSPSLQNTVALSHQTSTEASTFLRPRVQTMSGNVSNRFLPLKKFPVDKVFFGDEIFGNDQGLNADVEGEVFREDMELKVNSPPFGFVERTSFPGVQNYVYRQMQHYFRQQPVEVQFKGKMSQAVFPYRSNLVSNTNVRSLIFLESAGSSLKPVLLREADLDLVQDPENRALDPEDFEKIRRWEKEAHKILPLYGQSDDEDNGYSSSFEAELEEEEHDQKIPKGLTKDEMSDTIESTITAYIEDWAERKLPLRQEKALDLWKRGKSSNQRIVLAFQAEANISTLSDRLDALVAELKRDQWPNVRRLRAQCACLEETVHQREELRFKAGIWRQGEAPARPTLVSSSRIREKKALSIHESEGEGIVLDSDDDVPSERLSDFIEDELIHDKDTAPIEIPEIVAGGSKIHNDLDDDRIISKAQPTEVIDLTLTSTDSEQYPLAVRSKSKSRLVGKAAEDQYDNVVNQSEEAVLQWRQEDLEAQQDRIRLIVKLIRTMPADQYDDFRQYIVSSSEEPADNQMRLRDNISLATKAVRDGKTKIAGLPLEEYEYHIRAAHLFACWYYCSAQHFLHKSLSSEEGRELGEHIQRKYKDVMEFAKLVERTLRNHKLPVKRKGPTVLEKQVESDLEDNAAANDVGDTVSEDASEGLIDVDDAASENPNEEAIELEVDKPIEGEEELNTDQPNLQSSPHKKRKRSVAEDKTAKERRQRARQNLESQEQRKLTLMSSNLMDAALIAVNPGKSDEHDFIYLNSHISSRIHKHQIEGLQFLWREIVATDMDEADRQGALLSHTMGLGKTMQAISLLVTIAEAAASPNPKINSQIPSSLRKSRTLIICPSALISNWLDEFDKWMPPETDALIGRRLKISSQLTQDHRLGRIREWSQEGGILLIGYDLFRDYINIANTTKLQLSDEEHKTIRTQLTDHARIVIADEAHKLKNPKSGVGKAASGFRTSARIALTGSPLSNNLGEYYSMINWIAPGYLGNATEFRANYEEPIREGGYVDSTSYERRKAMKKLKVLEEVTEPKIHRRDVTVLQGTLAAKTEFVFTVPLTILQEKLYGSYLSALNGEDIENISQTRIFDWLGTLSLVCSHPMAFSSKLQERKLKLEKKMKGATTANKIPSPSPVSTQAFTLPRRPKSKRKAQGPSDSGLATTPQTADDDVTESVENGQDVSGFGLSLSTIKELEETMEKLSVNGNEMHSVRTMLLHQILQKSKELGDQVLVFSQSIETLNFLEKKLKEWNIGFFRLDGKTNMDKRPADIKAFNEHEREVYLISTRAGGLGVNLPAANRVVIFDFMFNPQWEEQAIGRAYRIGQQKPVYVYRFIAGGTFEEKLFNQAVFKTQLAFKVVEKKNTKNFAQRQMDYLFKPKKVNQLDLEGHKGKDSLLDDILSDMQPDEDGRYLIRKIISAEILKDPAEDVILTQEDEQEIQQELANNRLRKNNPAAHLEQQRRTYGTTQIQQHPPQQYSDILGGPWSNRNPQLAATPQVPTSTMLATADGRQWPATQVLRDKTNEPSSLALNRAGIASTQPDSQARNVSKLRYTGEIPPWRVSPAFHGVQPASRRPYTSTVTRAAPTSGPTAPTNWQYPNHGISPLPLLSPLAQAQGISTNSSTANQEFVGQGAGAADGNLQPATSRTPFPNTSTHFREGTH